MSNHTLTDAATVCRRRDEFGHTHNGEADCLTELQSVIDDIASRAVTGEAPAGYALVPNDAFTALLAFAKA